MKMSDKLRQGLNNQINAEFWSAYQYLSMSASLADMGYMGMSHWMFVQYQEELVHMNGIVKYLINRGQRVKLKPIDAVSTDWESPLDIFKESAKHEGKVSAMFAELMDTAVEDRDYAAQSMLTGFINEQVEEEANFAQQVTNLKLAEGHSSAMLMLDKEMGSRMLDTKEF